MTQRAFEKSGTLRTLWTRLLSLMTTVSQVRDHRSSSWALASSRGGV
jgi:hypothetical protein